MPIKPDTRLDILTFGPAPRPSPVPAHERATLKGLDVQDSDFVAWVEAGGQLPPQWLEAQPKKKG